MIAEPRKSSICAALCVALALAVPSAHAEQGKDESTPVEIAGWGSAGLYEGWSSRELLGTKVTGEDHERVGEVEDFIVGPDGRIRDVVIKAGDALGIGEKLIAVPWDEVERTSTTSISAPVTTGNVENYGLFESEGKEQAKPEYFRVREMTGDVVRADGVGYGTIHDVIFSQDGKIQAVVADPAYGYGYNESPVPLPYRTAYDPHERYYSVPYTTTELDKLRPFDYEKMK